MVSFILYTIEVYIVYGFDAKGGHAIAYMYYIIYYITPCAS